MTNKMTNKVGVVRTNQISAAHRSCNPPKKNIPHDKAGNHFPPQEQKWFEAENHPCEKNEPLIFLRIFFWKMGMMYLSLLNAKLKSPRIIPKSLVGTGEKISQNRNFWVVATSLKRFSRVVNHSEVATLALMKNVS